MGLDIRTIKKAILITYCLRRMYKLKIFLQVLAQLFDNWADGTNDEQDLQVVADAVVELINVEFDDELDELLSKPFVGSALGFIATVLRKLSD